VEVKNNGGVEIVKDDDHFSHMQPVPRKGKNIKVCIACGLWGDVPDVITLSHLTSISLGVIDP